MAIVINGSGTVTGLAVGGLPDGTVDAGTLATDSVDSAELIDGAIDASHMASGFTGKVVQIVNHQNGGVITGTGVIPLDNSIPQIAEGSEFMTLAITPTSATNKLKIEVVFQNWISAQNVAVVALFQDTTANALATGKSYVSGGDRDTVINFSYIMTTGTTSATTFKVRAGVNSAGTTAMNGRSGAIHGGALSSSITIIEYEA